MDLKVECQKTEANKINAPGTFIHCMVKTPGTNRLSLRFWLWLGLGLVQWLGLGRISKRLG